MNKSNHFNVIWMFAVMLIGMVIGRKRTKISVEREAQAMLYCNCKENLAKESAL